MSKVKRPFEGVIPNLERLYQESESEFTRNRLKGFMSPQFCDACLGQRLKPEILSVTLGRAEVAEFRPATSTAEKGTARGARDSIPGLSIMDVCGLSVSRANAFFGTLQLSDFEEKIAHEIVKEIRTRLGFLENV